MYSNDEKHTKIHLEVRGNIISSVSVNPQKVHLWGNADENISKNVSITPIEGFKFNITDITPANGDNIEYKLNKKNNGAFELVITNTKKNKGSYSDILFLKTDNKDRPAIRINIYGNIK